MAAIRTMRTGLTLLEVIISLALIGMLLGAMLTFYQRTLAVRDDVIAYSERMQLARQVLARIETELRGCVGFEEFNFPIEQPIIDEDLYYEDEERIDPAAAAAASGAVPLLIGDRRSIQFLTTTLPADYQYEFYAPNEEQRLPPARHDLTQVSYRLWIDSEENDENGEPIVGGIIRTEKRTLNQYMVDLEEPLHVRNDLWSAELGYLEFRYYDGVEWTTEWNLQQGRGITLPQIIQVTVGYRPITQYEMEDNDLDDYPIAEWPYGDDKVHGDRYSVLIRLPAADQFFSSRIQRVGQQMTEQLGVEGFE